MYHDLQPTLGRSEVLHYDLKGRQIGLFVVFYGFSPALSRLGAVEYELKGLKIGKSVICRDQEPTLSRAEVTKHHLKPTWSRSKVMSHHSEPASGRQEMTIGRFRGDVTNEGIIAWHPRCVPSARQGLCRAENTNAETACAVSKQTSCLTLKLLML